MCDDPFPELIFCLALSLGCFYTATNVHLRRFLHPPRRGFEIRLIRWEQLTAKERAEADKDSKEAFIIGGLMSLGFAVYKIVKALLA